MFFVSFPSIKVTIYAIKNPTGNNTDLNERLSRAKEYLTRDDILDALLDEDGNLSPNLTNDKELEVRRWFGAVNFRFSKQRNSRKRRQRSSRHNRSKGVQRMTKIIGEFRTNINDKMRQSTFNITMHQEYQTDRIPV